MTIDQVRSTAERMGLVLTVTETPSGQPAISVQRSAEDWSVPPMMIAIGQAGLADRAMAALSEMRPKLERAVASAEPDEERLPIAAGVGSDGTVTTLRVERDGSVRLSDADIDRIAEAVALRMRRQR